MTQQMIPAGFHPQTGAPMFRPFDPYGIMGPLTLDNVRAEDLQNLAQQGLVLKRGWNDYLIDSHRYIAGTAVPTSSQVSFFTVPVGGSTAVDNSPSTTYNKTDIDTNIVVGNQLPKGEIFLVKTIQVMIVIDSAIDNTVTSGLTVDPTPKAATTPISPANTLRALVHSASIQLLIGSNIVYEYGPLWEFPCEFGFTGWAGTGTSLNNESLAQNGFGRARVCMPYHYIDAGRRYGVNLFWRNAVVPNQNFILTVMLGGLHMSSAG